MSKPVTPSTRASGPVQRIVAAFPLGPFGSVFLGLALLGCHRAPGTEAGCSKDTDCKAQRVCEDGRCVAAAPAPMEQSVTAPSESAPIPPPKVVRLEWWRGGPGSVKPLTVKGPVKAPDKAWDVDLGTVVYATPRIATHPKVAGGAPVAYVGTHGGRIVGIVVSGALEGQTVFDVRVEGRVWASPAIADGILYVGSDHDRLYAFEIATRDLKFELKLGKCRETRAPGPEGARCDVDGGPTLGPDGDLYVGADGIYRISPRGTVRWHYPKDEDKPKHVYSTPVVTSDGMLYVGGQDGHVTALEAGTGALKWRYKVVADVDGSPAMATDGTVFVGADDGRVYALRSDGSLRWSFVAQDDVRSSVASGPGDRLYVTSHDGNLYALKTSGEVEWVLGTAGKLQSSPVVDAEGVVYFGGQDAYLYAVSHAGKVLWRVEMPEQVDSSVAIADDGTVVVGCDDGHLRAFRAPPAK